MPTDPITGICELCGEPMPPNEQMFRYHGYSGPCPKQPLPKLQRSAKWWMEKADREGDSPVGAVGGAVPDPITVEVVCDACDATGQASDRHDCWACGGEGTRLMVASPNSRAALEIALARAVDRMNRASEAYDIADGKIAASPELTMALRDAQHDYHAALAALRAHPDYEVDDDGNV